MQKIELYKIQQRKTSALIILVLLFFHIVTFAQNVNTIDPNLDKKGDNYINRQTETFILEIKRTITDLPPQYPLPSERYLGLLLIDAVLHDVYAAQRPAVQVFFHSQIMKAVKEIESTTIEEGAKIWQLYNHGFIVRTKSITIAFDMVTGESAQSDGFTLSSDIMSRLIDQCDALFISHRHRDHTDIRVAQQFLDQNDISELLEDRDIF